MFANKNDCLSGLLIATGTGLPYPGYFPYDTLESAVSTASRFSTSLIEQLKKPVPVLPTPRPSPPPPTKSSSLFSYFRSSPSPSSPQSPAAIPKPRKTSKTPSTTSSHLIVPKFRPGSPQGASIDVATTLQYGQASGFGPLAEFIKDFSINYLHGGRIPYENPEILLTCGNTDALGKVMQMIAERGDNMLVEEYTYPNAIQTADPYGVSMAPVRVDAEGMLAEGKGGLRDVLENWDHRRFGRRPRFMYTVTLVSLPRTLGVAVADLNPCIESDRIPPAAHSLCSAERNSTICVRDMM